MSRLQRRVAALAGSLALIGGIVYTAGPAAAAAPGNDTKAGAVVIPNSLPYNYTQSTTEATVDSGESAASSYCLGVGAPAFEHAVWFKATIPAGLTQAIRVDVSASDYGAGIAVLLDNGGTLSAIDCVPGAYVTPGAPAAGTYYLVVFGDGTTATTVATSTSRSISFHRRPTFPSPSTRPGLQPRKAEPGSPELSPASAMVRMAVFSVDGSITQTVGRLIISSYFSSGQSIPCDGETYPWQAYAPPTNGKFSGGKSITVSTAFGCNDAGCNAGYAEATVRLNRATIK